MLSLLLLLLYQQLVKGNIGRDSDWEHLSHLQKKIHKNIGATHSQNLPLTKKIKVHHFLPRNEQIVIEDKSQS